MNMIRIAINNNNINNNIKWRDSLGIEKRRERREIGKGEISSIFISFIWTYLSHTSTHAQKILPNLSSPKPHSHTSTAENYIVNIVIIIATRPREMQNFENLTIDANLKSTSIVA